MNWLLFSVQAFLGLALLFYVLFAGADFGAGILELFVAKNRAGEQRELTSRAMAPVWEANHVWLILAVVILFVAFPSVYALVSTSLYLPLMAVLVGIVARGTAFTFRHYDTLTTEYYSAYSKVFAISSLWTAFFLGVAAGAWALGSIDIGAGDFYGAYVSSWLNPFCFAMGAFTVSLFALLASVYFLGETRDSELKNFFRRRSAAFNIAAVSLGGLVFFLAELQGRPLLRDFFAQPISVACFVLASLLLVVFWRNLIWRESTLVVRIVGAATVALVLLGWYAVQYPAILSIHDSERVIALNFADVAAPPVTLRALLVALIIGALLIFPSLIYLLKIFKRDTFRRDEF